MKTFMSFGLFMAVALAAGAAQPATYQHGPKNLVAPTYRAPVAPVAAPHQLTSREVKNLAATAESAVDHFKLVRYYRAEADRLDAKAATYEEAAATYRHGPMIKNLMAPTTPARYEYFAKGLREEAKSDRDLSTLHERMARASASR
jgi:hypothetical protein